MGFVLMTLYFPFGFQTSIETGFAIEEPRQSSSVKSSFLFLFWGGLFFVELELTMVKRDFKILYTVGDVALYNNGLYFTIGFELVGSS